MYIEHFLPNLEKRSVKNGLKVKVGKPADASVITAFEKRNAIRIPEQVRWFYQNCDRLKIDDPT